MDIGINRYDFLTGDCEATLADHRRVSAFKKAIRAAVRPGDVVAHVGCGAGLLAMMTVEAGAARVITVVPGTASAEMVRAIVADNGMADRIEVVAGDAATLDIGQQVDMVICEMIGSFGPECGIERAMGAFCARHLKPEGTTIPRTLSTCLAPVAFDGELSGLWWEDSHGFDLSSAGMHLGGGSARYVSPARPWDQLSAPATLETLSFGAAGVERDGDRTARFTVNQPARLEGFLGWFEADLGNGIRLSSRIRQADSSWKLWCWPITRGVPMDEGQVITAGLHDQGQPTNALGWRLDWVAQKAVSPADMSTAIAAE
ncbi:MAG: hypothetical protein RLY86_2339 [Pseudomonadota bacterium]|jgi:hypothetical protein